MIDTVKSCIHSNYGVVLDEIKTKTISTLKSDGSDGICTEKKTKAGKS